MAYVPGFSPYLQNSIRPTPGIETMGGDPFSIPDFASTYLQNGIQPTPGIEIMQPSVQPTPGIETMQQSGAQQAPAQDYLSYAQMMDMAPGGGAEFGYMQSPTDYNPAPNNFGRLFPNAKKGNPLFRPSATPSLDFVDYDGQQGFFFTTNTGRAATTKANPNGFVPVDANATYRLIDEKAGRLAAEGVGADGLKSVYQTAQMLSAQGGKKADWKLEQLNPATGKWTVVGDDDPKANVLGMVADIALPVAGALLLPGVGGFLGGALGAGLGAAGGSALSSIAQGRSIEDTLMRAAVSGVGAGGLSAIGGAPFIPAGGGGGAGGALAGSAAGAGTFARAGIEAAGLQALANPGITVLGNAAGGALGSTLGAGAGALAGGAAGNVFNSTTGQNQIIAEGSRPPSGPVTNVVESALAGAGSTQVPDSRPVTEEGYIEVTNNRPNPNGGAGNLPIDALLPALPLATAPLTPVQTPDLSPEIVVERDRLPTSFDTPVPPLPLINTPVTPVQTPNVQNPPGRGLDVVEILRAAGLLTGLVGGALEGGGGGLGRVPAGLGGLSLDNSPLPAPNIPGLGGEGVMQRPQGNKTTQDWYRYGYGPEQSFFNYVAEAAPNTSQAFTGYAEGGEVSPFAVNGPGTGRSDDIPALLSDGEYVIDAETVALLGDGSTKAGAERLDQFRVNVRKHKGKQLAKGGFSVDAKRPEAYMTGGTAR